MRRMAAIAACELNAVRKGREGREDSHEQDAFWFSLRALRMFADNAFASPVSGGAA